MADGRKFEDGQSTPEGIMDIHKGVDQDVPREGIETPGDLFTGDWMTILNTAGTIRKNRQPRNRGRGVQCPHIRHFRGAPPV